MTTYLQGTLKGLIDSTPDVAQLINLREYYAGVKLPETGVDSHLVYECPRTQLMIRTAVKGTTVGTHFHTVADEYVIVVGGSGEIMVNGQWTPVKMGDVHVCPRGVIHDTRALEENLQYLSIFTPHLPAGSDINWL